MFAWEFAARAGAAKRRFGQIDLRLIRGFAASLTQAPGGLFIGAERLPLPRRSQALSGFGRRRIRREGENLFSAPVHFVVSIFISNSHANLCPRRGAFRRRMAMFFFAPDNVVG